MCTRIFAIAFLVTLPLAAALHATVVEYHTDDRAQWFTDVGGAANVSTVDFVGYDDFTPVSDQWAHLGVLFSGSVFTSGESNVAYPNDGWGLEGYPDINVAFDGDVNWIAADFPGQTMIELYSGDDLIFTSTILGAGGAGFFGGLISDIPFDRARFFELDNDAEFLDDLHFGPPINVPGPGALMAIGLGLLARRRRSRLAS